MTVAELQEILVTYPDDQFVHMRIWLDPCKDYLDDGLVQAVATKVQQGVDGALLITGSVSRGEYS